jgi:hypothetical protein
MTHRSPNIPGADLMAPLAFGQFAAIHTQARVSPSGGASHAALLSRPGEVALVIPGAATSVEGH